MFRQGSLPPPVPYQRQSHLTVPPFTLEFWSKFAPIISPLVCFFVCEKVQKKKPPIIIISGVVAVFFLESAFFCWEASYFFFARILIQHLIHREFHQILHTSKMLKIHICPIYQDSVTFPCFFSEQPKRSFSLRSRPCASFFLGGLSTLQLNFDGSQHQEVQGVRCSQGKSNLQRMDCIRQVGIGKSKKKITTKIHARLRLLYLKKTQRMFRVPPPPGWTS